MTFEIQTMCSYRINEDLLCTQKVANNDSMCHSIDLVSKIGNLDYLINSVFFRTGFFSERKKGFALLRRGLPANLGFPETTSLSSQKVMVLRIR